MDQIFFFINLNLKYFLKKKRGGYKIVVCNMLSKHTKKISDMFFATWNWTMQSAAVFWNFTMQLDCSQEHDELLQPDSSRV
jgi:hypothetical protein